MLIVFETKGEADRTSVNDALGAALSARSNGEDAVVVLLQSGVLLALGAEPHLLDEVLNCGIAVYIDRFSLLQRRIAPERLIADYQIVDADDLVNLIFGDDVRIIWH